TGTIVAEPTGEQEDLEVGMVFRSVGYRGVALPGVPFQDRWGVILNERGRVLDPESGTPVTGEYVAGWIKRGPTGVIGTNKPDSAETVACMLEDAEAGRTFPAEYAGADIVDVVLQPRQVRYDTFDDWLRLDALEAERGAALGRPRVKFTSVEEMLAAMG